MIGNIKSILFVFTLGALLFSTTCGSLKQKTNSADLNKPFSVIVSVDKLRYKVGETVTITAEVQTKSPIYPEVRVLIFGPIIGARNIDLHIEDKGKQTYKGEVQLKDNAPLGLYVVTAYARTISYKTVGKAWFLVGKIIGDPFSAKKELSKRDNETYLADFMKHFIGLGGNLLLVFQSSDELNELALSLADKHGLTVILIVQTYIEPYSKRTEHLKQITAEFWQSCKEHPCVVGIYLDHEGSGLYWVPFVKDFCDYAKTLEGKPLTICAPYIEDPDMIGYLATIDSLDIIELQCQIIGSRRSDNRSMFPMTRCRDHGCLNVSASLPKDKIALCQIEQYAPYTLEKKISPSVKDSIATIEDIYLQAIGVATAPGVDGLIMSSYFYSIYGNYKNYPDEISGYEQAFARGMKDYKLINSKIAIQSDPIVFYYPYQDWNVHCWRTAYCPAFSAFRRLGIPFGIVPFIPKKGEEVLPYYPMNLNEEQLKYLLQNKFVVVMPDVPGMEETDSILLKRFVENGGIAILFGPHIPYGDRFDRTELCGGSENQRGKHSKIEIKKGLYRRTKEVATLDFAEIDCPSWTPAKGKSIAVFEDGSTAVLLNEVGKGKVFTIPISVSDAVHIMPDFMRDIFDYALEQKGVQRLFDIKGANEDTDIAMSKVEGGLRLAIVNHRKEPIDITICPLDIKSDALYQVADIKTGNVLYQKSGKDLTEIRMNIKGYDFIAIMLTEKH